ncbi:small ubiquitin-related modifier 1-like isoform X2 [Elaeis guineensis]|uniref:Small ubiquitin-related modifier 1-like isoform X3 n=1 Tax=Elaeis guineensis var. tenera TaxID=51953 RepID=A0A6J0PKU8_ELAGV|nr:small ubiquitin-related modifier 1-like isoform X3 [Elaeis guineensis]
MGLLITEETSGYLEHPQESKEKDGYDSVTVRVKRSIKMKDLMKAYNDRRSVGDNTFEFLLDGHRIQGEQTPDELEMKDGDEIDAMVHGHGGSAIW